MAEHFPESPEIWAHRGARAVAPENTLAAGKAALAQGAGGWEVDVRLSADGVCVLLHDMGLLRTTNASRRRDKGDVPPLVQTTSLEKLRHLSAGSWFARRDPFGAIAAGRIPAQQLHAFQTEPVPTLKEALAFTRRNCWRINVEIKVSGNIDDTIIREVCREIQAQDMTAAVIVSSFRRSYLDQIQTLCPKIETAWLVKQIPPHILDLLPEWCVSGLHVHQKYADPATVAMLRDRGVAVRVYTVNQPAAMEHFVKLGVDGIITDHPDLLRRIIQTV